MRTRNKLSAFIILLLLLTACNHGEVSKKVPAHVIKKNKMVEILADMHLADAGISTEVFHPDSIALYHAKYYYAILEKHGVAPDYFEESMDFYLIRPALLQEVYEKVNEMINAMQAEHTE